MNIKNDFCINQKSDVKLIGNEKKREKKKLQNYTNDYFIFQYFHQIIDNILILLFEHDYTRKFICTNILK